MTSGPRRVAMVVFPDVQMLDVTGPLEVFAPTARWLVEYGRSRTPAYSVELLASHRGIVRSSSGIELVARRSFTEVRHGSAQTERNSPIRHLPSGAAPLVVAVGMDELPELVRQSEEYAAAWRARGLRGRYLRIPSRDHFSILEELAEPTGAILTALRELA